MSQCEVFRETTAYKGWRVDNRDPRTPYYSDLKSESIYATVGSQSSELRDAPVAGVKARSYGKQFITAAIGIRHGKTPEYLGSVRWGFYIYADGTLVFDPENGPTIDTRIPPELGPAISRWNKVYPKGQLPALGGVEIADTWGEQVDIIRAKIKSGEYYWVMPHPK